MLGIRCYNHFGVRMTYKTGQITEGRITGIQPYGAFVALDAHTSGLIHISEISDGFVKDIERFVSVGDTVRVKIIDFDPKLNQAKLSLKALHRSRVRNRRRPVVCKAGLPPNRLGFRTVEANMKRWIAEAQEEMRNDEV